MPQKLYSLLLLLCIVALSTQVFSQDIHYADLSTNPLKLNPASTGMFDGRVRASAFYDNQWSNMVSTGLRTYGLSFDMPVYINKKGDYLAAGMQVTKEDARYDNLANFSGTASVAYHRIFSIGKYKSEKNNSDLAIGVQGAYNQNSANFNDPYFSYISYPGISQYAPGGTFDNYSVNLGACFSHATGAHFNYTIGLSGYHLNQPSDATKTDLYRELGIDPIYMGQAGANWILSDRIMLRPEIVYGRRMSNGKEFIFGNEFHYKMKHHATALFLGLFEHSSDVLLVAAGVEYKGLQATTAYGYNVLPLIATSGYVLGGYTLSLRYNFPINKSGRGNRIVPSSIF